MEAKEERASTVFDYRENVEDPTLFLRALKSLQTSSKLFSLETHVEILFNHPDLKTVFKKHESFIRSLLQRHCQTNDLYFHGIFGGRLDKSMLSNAADDLQQPIGTGWYIINSLRKLELNHIKFTGSLFAL